jgi:membrane-associated phospholipid phosphatase
MNGLPSPSPSPVRGRGGILFALLAAFAALTLLVSRGATDRFDGAVLRWVQGHLLPHAAWFWEIVSWPGYAPQSYGVALLFVLLGWQYAGRWGAVVMLLALLASPLGSVLKVLIGRPRPTPEQARVIGKIATSAAYPSGHVLTYTVVCGLLFLLIRDALPVGRRERRSDGTVCGILAASIVLVGPSRVALGDHWPTDVLGAYLLGGALLTLLARRRLAAPRARPSEAPE